MCNCGLVPGRKFSFPGCETEVWPTLAKLSHTHREIHRTNGNLYLYMSRERKRKECRFQAGSLLSRDLLVNVAHSLFHLSFGRQLIAN